MVQGQRTIFSPSLDSYTQSAYSESVRRTPAVVVETDRFLKDAAGLISELERSALIAFVASNPQAGRIIPESGGVWIGDANDGEFIVEEVATGSEDGGG